MPISRYALRRQALNTSSVYEEYFKNRGLKFVKQYRTGTLTYPTQAQLRDMPMVEHLWKVGDRYEKLAHQYYGDSKLWWIIAWINRKPAEFFNSLGDVLFIPTSVESALAVLNV
jgi:hypothetical protein